MRGRLRQFAAVGAVATVIDVGVAVALLGAGWAVWAADVVALGLAAVVARVLHRLVTLRDDPYTRWIRLRRVFVTVVVLAGLVDLGVLAVARAVLGGVNAGDAGGWESDLLVKVVAVLVAGLVRAVAYRSFLFRVIRREQDHPSDRGTPPGDFRVSVVIPAYQESDRIATSIVRVRTELGAALAEMTDTAETGSNDGVEIVVVDDGSADDTAAVAGAAGADRVVRLDRNRGKGSAVRAGVAVATGRTVVFTDADLAYGPAQAAKLVVQIEQGYDVVVGSRRHTETKTLVRAGRLREVGGRLINLVTHAFLLGQYRDTQCGLKAFRADIARPMFAASVLERFAFDVEIFHLVERWRLSLIEVPVEVENSERSTVRVVRDGVRLMVDLVRVRQRARRGDYPALPVFPVCDSAISGDLVGQIFKAYDIRGRVPDEWNNEVAESIGRSFGHLVRRREPNVGRVVVGRDMRPSGVPLGEALIRGVTSVGLDVVDVGLASTDLVSFASGYLQAPAMMVTASHNPPEYNGIKCCLSGASPLGYENGLNEVKAAVLASAPVLAADNRLGNVISRDLLGLFSAHVRSFVDTDQLRPLRLVVDTANGMGGLVVPAVFKELPFVVDYLYPELDGTFPNHPADPIQPENLRDLQARVQAVGADLGLAFDGDADRVFLVDEQSCLVSGSTTTALVAREILRNEPGAIILHNLICSKAVPEVVAEEGGRAIRTRVGHSLIKQAMAVEKAAFAGEHSGHYYFRDNFRADSGLIAALIILKALSVHNGPMSELTAPLERYAASGERNTKVQDPKVVIERVAAHYCGQAPEAVQDQLDGLTVDFGDWWFNLRPSNTEPLLRLNVEAMDYEACATRVEEVQSLFL
ncbi:MAG: glycosyltransferase [Acidimicrobiales bacterium]|nr:glycosyltransferase [Acidimicrobiales bacterium]